MNAKKGEHIKSQQKYFALELLHIHITISYKLNSIHFIQFNCD